MRDIQAQDLSALIGALAVHANRTLPPDIQAALAAAAAAEPWPAARQTLQEIVRNADTALRCDMPICQDTGLACVFVDWGQEAHLVGGSLRQAVDEGVRQGYEEGFLRKSVVADPLRRQNTKDNTPAQLTVHLVPGDQVRVTVMPKGFGSENMSALAMLKPADGRAGVENFICETVASAGANPCPPVVVGVGVGGSFDSVAALAKQALLRPVDTPNPDPFYAEMEAALLARINKLGTGPAGYGGATTALAVNIEAAPTHIAGLPVAVNMSCHATRRASGVL